MIGDAYFQLRAQVGTGLFSLLRLAAEANAQVSTQSALRSSQWALREGFTFVALGPEGGGKSGLLNALFEREFTGAAEPLTAGRISVLRYGETPREQTPAADVIECHRPHIFLRDFTLVEGSAAVPYDSVNPYLARADLIFFVVSAAAGPPDAWSFLSHLSRELLKRLVFVVWQSDRVSPEEGASAVKRLRQAMLKNLGQACPIFIGSKTDTAAREKLVRWIETEIIFSEPRRAKLQKIDEAARTALREIVNKPRAERQALDRQRAQVRGLRDDLIEREEQAERQVAGSLWALAQNTESLRWRAEVALRERLGPFALLWRRSPRLHDFAYEIEEQARALLAVQLRDHLVALEADLHESVDECLRESSKLLGEKKVQKPPEFPRESILDALTMMEPPLEVERAVLGAYANAACTLRLPLFAALAAIGVALGTAIAGEMSNFLLLLAVQSTVFVVLLAFLLRQNVIASLGRHFTENRASLVAVLDPPLRGAIAEYYAGIAPAVEARAEQLAGEGQRNEPLLARLGQIEETFARLENDLRSGLTRSESLWSDANAPEGG